MNVEEVKRISQASKNERWPYPRTFQELLGAGVTAYRTSIADDRIVYMGADNQYEETHAAPTAAPTLAVAEHFEADAVKRGLEHHQRNRTPFSDFLKDMADAGVHYYEVDMLARTINYTSGRPGESYVEAVPAFEATP
ncbi:DUF1398 domain-containing protein [Paenibacillus rhizovicinus]|uniref:DUF1398 domain-containing protein n=1 Tax=Paenibacillus rhizovicinus TaxID=2704463 RepID=A0A6C0NZS9_9BACL|nr:DUF1398 family protein [Paenibacillus rhizovicinus]QHW31728.1 DUF1398 domain-containing protein [Paenibacillus rhizovicinus]